MENIRERIMYNIDSYLYNFTQASKQSSQNPFKFPVQSAMQTLVKKTIKSLFSATYLDGFKLYDKLTFSTTRLLKFLKYCVVDEDGQI